jgi:hypothetical protein
VATSGLSPPLVEEAASLQASLLDHIFPSKRTTCVPATTRHYSSKTFLGGIVPLCILTNQGYIYYPVKKHILSFYVWYLLDTKILGCLHQT